MNEIANFGSMNDLANWVADHMGPAASADDVKDVTDAIHQMDHPAFGSNWAEFLETLPDNLGTLCQEDS